MSTERAKRTVKPPKKFDELEVERPSRQSKHIFRPLTRKDLTKDVLERELYILWPDNGQWYAAEIITLDLRTFIGTIEYTETEEEEKNVKVLDLVKSGEIAFKESKPISYKLKEGEIDAPDPTPQRSRSGQDNEGSKSSSEEDNGDGDASEEDSGEEGGNAEGKEEKAQAKQASAGADKRGGSAVTSAAKRAKGMSADDQPSTPSKRAKSEAQPVGKRQVLPTEKAMQLLREGNTGSNDFSAADAASRKMLESLMKRESSRGEARKGTSGPAFYGERKPPAKPSAQAPQAKSGSAAEKANKNATLQARYVDLIKGHLDKAAAEAKAAGREGANTDTQALATRVHDTMYKHFGGYGEEFRQKMRSVLYNLKDDKNQDFRGKVLRGEVPPAKICTMEPHDMASEEQQAHRRKIEEESLKNSVLDSAAAARFSTAAALEAAKEKGIAGTIDWRTSTLVGDEEPRDKRDSRDDKKEYTTVEMSGAEQPYRPPLTEGFNGMATTAKAKQAESEAKPGTPSALEACLSSGGTTSLAATSSFDWAKIREKTREEAANAPVKTKFEAFEDFGSEEAAEQAEDKDVAPEPELAPLSAEAARWQAVPDLAPIVASSSGRSPDIWSGKLTGIASHGLSVTADYLAGPADIAALLGQQEVHVKGRLPTDDAQRFFEELRRSRRRTCSIAILRSKNGPKQDFTDAVVDYSVKGRAGISEFAGGVEGYLVPPSDLAQRLIKTAYLAEGKDLRRESDGVPEELDTDQMLLLLVHLKDWHQHIMQTEQAQHTTSPVHATSPEHTLAEKPSISPAHVPSPLVPGVSASPHHATASPGGAPASPPAASAAAERPPLAVSHVSTMDPRQRSADPRQQAADPRRAAAQAQVAPASPPQMPNLAPAAAPAPASAAPGGLDFSKLGVLAQLLGVGVSMPTPAAPQQQGLNLASAAFPQSSQSFAPQYQPQQQEGMQQQPQYQQVQQPLPSWGQPGQAGPQDSQPQPQQQLWQLQTSLPGSQGLQQQQQLPRPPPMQQQAWQPQLQQQPPTLAPPQQGMQSPMHGQQQQPQQQPYGQQPLPQQQPPQQLGYPGGLPQQSGQMQGPVQLPAPQPQPQTSGPPRPITLAPPGQPRQQPGPRPQQPITLPPPGQQHLQRPPGPITLRPPVQMGPPPAHHPQQPRLQAPITLKPPPGNPRQQQGQRAPGAAGGRGGGRGGGRVRADRQHFKSEGGGTDEASGKPPAKRPRVMGPGAKAVAGFQG